MRVFLIYERTGKKKKFKNTMDGVSDVFLMGFVRLPLLDLLALGSPFLPSVALGESVC